VGFIDSGVIDGNEYDAGPTVELANDGYAAEFHAYRRAPVGMELEPQTIGYDVTVSVRLTEPASTYRDVFTTEWETVDVD
jgi:hypothetical protein